MTGMQDFFGRPAAAPDRVVLVMAETGARFTAGEVAQRALAMAQWLHTQGLQAGERFAVVLENRVEILALVLAAREAGVYAAVRSAHLTADEIEFLRWRSERWMKVRHMPAVLRRRPGFVLRNARALLAHTFRGSSWRSVVGLESAREVFRRYKAIRARERDYVTVGP